MRLLHTADWHLGKRLYGQDRRDEARAALHELVTAAERERVDAVLVAGDLLDRRVVDALAFEDCLGALERLARVAPVLVVTGNHDDPDLWAALAPFLVARGIHVRSRVGTADEAVLSVETRSGPLHAALLPWPPQRGAAELGRDEDAAKVRYADGVASVLRAYADRLRELRRAQGGAAVLVGHLMVDGALAGGGERELTMGITYAVSPAALPADLDYLALGHVHRPQAVPRVSAPGWYAGSPMALDFSEDTHTKSACVVDVSPQRTTTGTVPLTAARPLVRLRGPLDRLAELATPHGDAWFLCEVALDGPVLDLVRQVREAVPGTLRVEPRYAAPEPVAGREPGDGAPDAGGPRLGERYAEWYAAQGRVLAPQVAEAFAAAVAAAAREAEATA
ncbi:MAG TPA: exonuclease SbcCD subunit D [Miltoncostaeaceae bacterium]|nr:exonuclease SbcCD subunit D [Miltoncostaeaceae bacterium]